MNPLRVQFIVPYPLGQSPGQRFRFEQWLEMLPPEAIAPDVLPLFDERAYRSLYREGGHRRKIQATIAGAASRVAATASGRRADVTFVYREAFPLGPPLFERLMARQRPVVYDFDDAIWLGDTSAANRWIRRLKAPSKVDEIIELATTTTVGNEYLRTHALDFTTRVEVLPTTLDVDRYRPAGERPRRDRLRIGWSGSPSTSKHLETITPALRRLVNELPVELVVIGDPDFELPGAPHVEVRPWSREREIDDVRSFDIGLMPLPDDEWSRGKCGFKALLYMALGVPTVASPVGVNSTIITSGENGLLATTEDQWVEAVGLLVDSARERERLGRSGRETVVEHYSGQRWAPRFLRVLEHAAASRSGSN